MPTIIGRGEAAVARSPRLPAGGGAGGRLPLAEVAASPDVPEARVCSVLRWMDGRVHAAAPRPVHLYRLGDVSLHLIEAGAEDRVDLRGAGEP
jgi:hypothetical protein